MNNLWALSLPWWIFVLRGSVVFLSVLLLMRIGGKRQVGQMGTGEFVAVLLISNAVQNSMNGGDNSITGGLILATVIIALSSALAYLAYRSRKCALIVEGQPRLLVHHGKPLKENLKKEWLTSTELLTMMRHQGF